MDTMKSSHTGRQVLSAGLSRRNAIQLFGMVGGIAALAGCGSSNAKFPVDDIEYVIPYDPGGSTDPIGREFSRLLAESLGTSTTPINMPGGNESIGATHVFSAKPDGYTLGLGSTAGVVAQPMLQDDLQYKGAESFTSIVKMVTVPYALMVAGDSPYKTLEDFIDDAKSKPGKLRVGLPNLMGGSAFALYALEDGAGIQATAVPSTGGSGEAALSVMGGRLEAMVGTAAGQIGLIEAEDMRALAYSSTGYEEFLPDAVSFEDAGYNVPFAGDYMTMGPADLPDDVKSSLVSASKEVAASKEWLEFCKKQAVLTDDLIGGEIESWLKKSRDDLTWAIELAQSRKS